MLTPLNMAVILFLVIAVLLQAVNIESFSSSLSTKGDYDEEKIIVCYFTNWAWYRSDGAKFTPENINASLCTHIFYAFASLDNNTLTIVPSDSWADIDNYFFAKVVNFTKSGIKVILSLGGWNDSAGTKYSRLFGNATARANFINTTIAFLDKYGFNGLDLDIEYPACPQGDRSAGQSGDKKNFNTLLSELNTAFGDDYSLIITTAGGKSLIEDCYDMVGVCQYLKFINIMAYEYHSHSDDETGAQAPMCGTGKSWGVVDTVKYYLEVVKCPANQIVLGIPFYAQTFTMVNSSPAEFGVAVSGAGTAGMYTQNAGTLAYYETCLLLEEGGWKIGFNKVNGSYASKDTQFMSLASEIDIVRKVCLIKTYNLGGAMFWALDYDDFNNKCGCGSYPLLKTLNQHLRCLNITSCPCY